LVRADHRVLRPARSSGFAEATLHLLRILLAGSTAAREEVDTISRIRWP
jgi:hypothetical protein